MQLETLTSYKNLPSTAFKRRRCNPHIEMLLHSFRRQIGLWGLQSHRDHAEAIFETAGNFQDFPKDN